MGMYGGGKEVPVEEPRSITSVKAKSILIEPNNMIVDSAGNTVHSRPLYKAERPHHPQCIAVSTKNITLEHHPLYLVPVAASTKCGDINYQDAQGLIRALA